MGCIVNTVKSFIKFSVKKSFMKFSHVRNIRGTSVLAKRVKTWLAIFSFKLCNNSPSVIVSGIWLVEFITWIWK